MSSLIRRTAQRRLEASQQLVIFSIHPERFALPIQLAYKVVPFMGGQAVREETRLIRYLNREILVLNIKAKLFQNQPLQLAGSSEAWSQLNAPKAHLLIVQNAAGDLIGLPVDDQPILQRVPRSQIILLSDTHLQASTLRFIQAIVKLNAESRSTFLLDLEALLSTVQLLPATPDEDT